MRHVWMWVTVVILGCALGAMPAVGASAVTLITFDAPGGVDTQARGINSAGQIVGVFTQYGTSNPGTGRVVAGNLLSLFIGGAGKDVHGYLRASGGAVTTVDVPGVGETFAVGINDGGQIVGGFTDSGGRTHGFLRSADGSFTTIDGPGGTDLGASGINSAGAIVGNFGGERHIQGGNFVVDDVHGFLRSSSGTLTVLDAPGAGSTFATGINSSGQIVGSFVEVGNRNSGFLRSPTGAFSVIEAPGAVNTLANGINDAGQIVGTFQDAHGQFHGYVRSADGTFTTVDGPNATETFAQGINRGGQIVGFFEAYPGMHGFVTH